MSLFGYSFFYCFLLGCCILFSRFGSFVFALGFGFFFFFFLKKELKVRWLGRGEDLEGLREGE